MKGADNPTRRLAIQDLAELRRKTEVISKHLHDQLLAHLETLRPLLSPERVFGKYVGSKADSALADRAWSQLLQNYKPFTTRPFDLPTEFDQHWLSLVGTRLALSPWEYAHEAKSERESRTISMTSSVRWVLTYSSAYTPAQLRQALAGKGERRPEHVRQFVVNALVTQLVLAHTPGLGPLLTDLRYHLESGSAPDLPRLPLTTISFGLPSFRPADDLILSATSLSGIPAFIELIDTEALSQLPDPVKARIEDLLR